MNSPSVTIGIVTKDRPEYLAVAIESAATQTVPVSEILVVDDGSRGETRDVLAPYLSRPDVRYIRIDGKGRSAARNRVVKEFKTDYLLWLDDDDRLAPTIVERSLETVAKHPNADVVYGNLIVCDEQLHPVKEAPKPQLHPSSMLNTFFHSAPVPNGGTLISRNCFNMVGEYDPFFERGQDYDFFSRAATAGVTFVHQDSLLYFYRSHSDNAATATQLRAFHRFRLAVIERLLRRHSLQELFPMAGWEADVNSATAYSCQEAAVQLVKVQGYELALSMLSQGMVGPFSELMQFLIGLVNVLKSQGISGVDGLRENPLFYTNPSQRILDVHMENEAPRQGIDRFRVEFLAQRLDKHAPEAIYPTLPWVERPVFARERAVVEIAGEFCLHRGFEEARQILSQLPEETDRSLRSFLLEMLNCYEHGGLERVNQLSRVPYYYHVLARSFANYLGQRDLRDFEQAQEDALTPALQKDVNLEWSDRIDRVINGTSEDPVVEPLELIVERSKPLFEEAAGIIAGSLAPATNNGHLTRERRFETLLRPEIDSAIEISVVIPTYNRPDLILQAALSVELQHGISCEVIVVDDAGTPLPASVIESFRELQLPITVVRHNENRGLAGSRNTGASIARGRWLSVLDDDDYLMFGAFESLLEAASRTNARFVYGDSLRQHYGNGYPVHAELRPSHSDFRHPLALESCIPSGSFIIKRELFEALSGYREDMLVHEDYNLNIRAMLSCESFHVDVPVMVYNLRGSIDRLTRNKRFYWLATAALNHAIFRQSFIDDAELRQMQRYAQYEHLAKALQEDSCAKDAAALAELWLETLGQAGAVAEIPHEMEFISIMCPLLLPILSKSSILMSNFGGYRAPGFRSPGLTV